MTLILGHKQGMTQLFEADGTAVGVTVVSVGPCVVSQVRTAERDGYHAVQLGYEVVRDKVVRKPQRGHFRKAGLPTLRWLREERTKVAATVAVGAEVKANAFKVGDVVDVIGTTKGRGFAGTVKRHRFQRGPKTHGCMNYRQPGSIGSSAHPSRVYKGKRMGGHMGAERHTSKNLRVVRVDDDQHLLFLAGAVPGPNGGFVEVRSAKTGQPRRPKVTAQVKGSGAKKNIKK